MFVCQQQDSNMPSLVPLKKKKFTEHKLEKLPSWIVMADSTPKDTVETFQRGYDHYYKLQCEDREHGQG